MTDELAGRCESGEALLRDRNYVGSLHQYAELLKLNSGCLRILRGAAESLLGCLNDPVAASSPIFHNREWLCTTLIHQAACNHSPPVLHELIAKHQDSSPIDPGPKIVAALGPSLQRIRDDGEMTKNSVLMMLILRASIQGWISQSEISTYHLSWLPRLTIDDMSLIYSCMFDPIHYQRNQSDIISLLDARPGANDLARDFSLQQLLLFEWISDRNLFHDQRLLDFVVIPKLSSVPVSTDLSAAKSLLVRHYSGGIDLLAGSHDLRELQPRLFELARTLDQSRESLKREAPRAATLSMRLFDKRKLQQLRGAMSVAIGRIPVSFSRKRRLRVALCVSGQLRGYKQAFTTWLRSLLTGVDYEIFVDSWTAVGRSGAEPFRSVLPFEGIRFTKAYREVGLRIPFDELKERYPVLFSTLADSGKVWESEVQSVYGTSHVHLDDDQETPFKAWTNQQKMHAKIESSVRMARKFGMECDLMIRIRPDKPIRALGFSWRDLLAFCRSAPMVFADHACGIHYGNLMIGDQLAIASPDVMDVYARTWSTYPRLAEEELSRCPPNFQGHVALAQVCWLHGIDVRKAPIFFGDLREAEPLSSRLIRDCLHEDARGRMDATDMLLLTAIAQDLDHA